MIGPRQKRPSSLSSLSTAPKSFSVVVKFLFFFVLVSLVGFCSSLPPSPASNSNPKFLLEIPTNGPIDDATCTIEDLERANDSQLHSILMDLKQSNFFKSFIVDLDHKCPLNDKQQQQQNQESHDEPSNDNKDKDKDQDEDEHEAEFDCPSAHNDELGLDDGDEPLCTVQLDDADAGAAGTKTENDFFGAIGGFGGDSSFAPATSSSPSFESKVLDSLSKEGFESNQHRQTFQWNQQTDIVVADITKTNIIPCDDNEQNDDKLLPDTFWMDMCSHVGAGDGTKVVNLALNPERNTGYNGTHIWNAIYEENCFASSGDESSQCLEERVLYRLLSGLHTSTTLSIAKNYYPPSKKKGRTTWEPNPQYFMSKFQDHPEYIRNLHFSYVVVLRALRKASPYLYNYDGIRSGNTVDDENTQQLLKRLLDSAILQSCSSVFSAFDESLMFRETSPTSSSSISLKQNFKGVFHNISSVLDCVQCQQCKLHGKMTMLGYGTALKILFIKPELLSLEPNEVVALINTIAKLSESMREVRELTDLYWEQQQQQQQAISSATTTTTTTTSTMTGTYNDDDAAAASKKFDLESFDLLDIAVGLIASLGRQELISYDREAELIQLALSKNPELMVLAKHYRNDEARFLALSTSIGSLGGESAAIANQKQLPDAIVVGSGLAGLAASLNILDRGGTVIIVEKEHLLGGNSNKASSGINACCPQGNLYNDTLDSFRNDTIRSAGEVAHLDLINTLVGNSGAAVAWLKERVGVDLSLIAQLGGHSNKRTHRPNNGMAGAEIIYHMQKAVKKYEKQGKVQIMIDTRVTKLLTENDDPNGRVIGVQTIPTDKSSDENTSSDLFAHNVILATGGFASDRSTGSYLDQYRPEFMSMPTTAGDFSTGDGITLAKTLGAGTRDMDKVQMHPTGWVDPTDPTNPTKILAAELMRGVGGMLINQNGKRFVNELGTRAHVTEQMLSHDPNYAKTKTWDPKVAAPIFHLVLSSSAAADGKKHVDLYTHKGLLTRVEGINALADKMNVSVRTLTSTLKKHQQAANKGQDEFGKTSFRGVPMDDLSNETFYVGQVTPVLHYCMGGITIDTQGNVLREDGSTIMGLHAAGEVTGGVHGNNRLGGNSLLECTVFGTIVGQKIEIQTTRTITNKSGTNVVMNRQDPSTATTKEPELPTISLAELAQHNTPDDCWVAIHGIVYDMTEFADEHPAGPQSIHDLAGTDGTAAFSAVHNQNMLDDFEEEKVGILQQLIVASDNDDPIPRQVTRLELEQHNSPEDCWVAFHGDVYNMTLFSQRHPGGSELIQNVAGTDGTEQFQAVHKKGKLNLVKDDSLIGTLVD